MGGHYFRRTGRTGLGGTGSPAQGAFGASCKANGGWGALKEGGSPRVLQEAPNTPWAGLPVTPRPVRPVL